MIAFFCQKNKYGDFRAFYFDEKSKAKSLERDNYSTQGLLTRSNKSLYCNLVKRVTFFGLMTFLWVDGCSGEMYRYFYTLLQNTDLI